ncbi:CerR family C-terminal domain-containing protein [Arvimicrobium flavum]|uniref:CerR family C-terminal domain-containing protein n=1 Tax=Arvimicrobium flavum TaxID=3393320 RepID=UPI00237A440B|nr:CerR family C-terminal domain-containing protein [Mesorhizobium shangrilense]
MSTIEKVPPTPPRQAANSADQTRLALIHAALQLFGSRGFEGTSTREIAAAAKANIGSIAYHFGSKEGLRQACAEHIAQTMTTLSAHVLAAAPDPFELSPQAARKLLKDILGTMTTFLVSRPESGEFVQFILRELAHPTAALDTIYNRMFAPMHMRICQVWAAITGEDAEAPATRIAVFTLIGQIVYFRIGREAVLRRMEWTDIGADEARQIVEAVTANLDAILAAHGAPPQDKVN